MVLEILVVHIIIYFVINALAKKYLADYKAVPNYLALFLPGLGGILVALLYFSLFYFRRDSMVLVDYDRYISYEHFSDYREKVDYEQEMRTLSFIDQMNLLDAGSKKQLIVDFAMDSKDRKVKLLHKGLTDGDGEVQHYSAVTINMLENEYTGTINKLREDFNRHKERDTLKKLVRVHRDYLESGLLSGEVLQVFNSEYIELLGKLSALKKPTPETLNELVRAYIRSGNLVQAEEANTRMLEHWPDIPDGRLNQLKIAYAKGSFKEVNRLLDESGAGKLKMDPKYADLFKFWTPKEEIL